MTPSIIFLAAGMGSRFGGPKQLEPLGPNGETLLDYSMYDAHRAGFGRAVMIIRHEMQEAFERTISARWQQHMPVTYVYQDLTAIPAGFQVPSDRRKPWGTGQALLAASEVVREPFAVLNADDFYGSDAFSKLFSFLAGNEQDGIPTYANVGFALQDTLSEAGSVNRAVLQLSEDGYLTNLREMIGIEKAGRDGKHRSANNEVHTIQGSTLVSMNMWGFTPAIFEQLERGFHTFLSEHGTKHKAEYLLPNRVQELIHDGAANVKVLRGSGPWCGITYPEDTEHVRQVLSQLVDEEAYPQELWS